MRDIQPKQPKRLKQPKQPKRQNRCGKKNRNNTPNHTKGVAQDERNFSQLATGKVDDALAPATMDHDMTGDDALENYQNAPIRPPPLHPPPMQSLDGQLPLDHPSPGQQGFSNYNAADFQASRSNPCETRDLSEAEQEQEQAARHAKLERKKAKRERRKAKRHTKSEQKRIEWMKARAWASRASRADRYAKREQRKAELMEEEAKHQYNLISQSAIDDEAE